MHGAWIFDLLLLVSTGGVTVVAFRQLTREQRDQTADNPIVVLSRVTAASQGHGHRDVG